MRVRAGVVLIPGMIIIHTIQPEQFNQWARLKLIASRHLFACTRTIEVSRECSVYTSLHAVSKQSPEQASALSDACKERHHSSVSKEPQALSLRTKHTRGTTSKGCKIMAKMWQVQSENYHGKASKIASRNQILTATKP